MFIRSGKISLLEVVSMRTINDGFPIKQFNGIDIDTSIQSSSANYYTYSSRLVKFIVIHYTGNKKDTAKANATYFHNDSRGASAHLFTDDDSCYQSVALNNAAWVVLLMDTSGVSEYYDFLSRLHAGQTLTVANQAVGVSSICFINSLFASSFSQPEIPFLQTIFENNSIPNLFKYSLPLAIDTNDTTTSLSTLYLLLSICIFTCSIVFPEPTKSSIKHSIV